MDRLEREATTVDGVAREYLAVYLKGIAMGTADAVPGMSGGTIALITGIYERLIAAITALDPSVLAHLSTLHRTDSREALVGDLLGMDVPFLAALGLGVVSALVTVSRVAHVALQSARAATFAFFLGLIAASAYALLDEVDVTTPGRIGAAVVGFGGAFVLSGPAARGALPNSPLFVASGAAVAICATVLPGISGATFLVLLGQYEFLTGELTAFVDGLLGLATGGSVARVLDPATTVLSFGAGAVVGLLTMAHAIEWALRRYRAATLTFLVSLLVGTLRLPVVEIRGAVGQWSATAGGTLVVATVLGAAAVLALDRYTGSLDY